MSNENKSLKSNTKVLYMVIPCYNETEVIGLTASVLKDKYEALPACFTNCRRAWASKPSITTFRWYTGATVSGWTSTLVSIWAIGDIQLISVGVLGEYIGKIFLETKRRPRFIISDWVNKG